MLHDGNIERTFEAFAGLELGFVPGSSPGQALRRVREARGLSIADVSRHTRIAERHLHSIEAADYGGFRSSIYAVGFARNYARYLGVAEGAIGTAVRAEFGEASGTAIVPDVPRDAVETGGLAAKIWVGLVLLLVVACIAVFALR